VRVQACAISDVNTLLCAAPVAVVTRIGPVVALAGTTAVIVGSLTTVKLLADVPLKLTLVAPVKLVPIMVMVSPAPPLAGAIMLITGAGGGNGGAISNVNTTLVAVPAGVAIVIGPVVAPIGTTAAILVSFTIVKLLAATPLKLTLVAPVRFAPLITTVIPIEPLGGAIALISGAGAGTGVTTGAGIGVGSGVGSGVVITLSVNTPLLAVPLLVAIVIGPVVAPVGTTAAILVSLTIAKLLAATSLKLTLVVPLRFVPVITTVVPISPLLGAIVLIVGITAGGRSATLSTSAFELPPPGAGLTTVIVSGPGVATSASVRTTAS
jgi:hypothetical protein